MNSERSVCYFVHSCFQGLPVFICGLYFVSMLSEYLCYLSSHHAEADYRDLHSRSGLCLAFPFSVLQDLEAFGSPLFSFSPASFFLRRLREDIGDLDGLSVFIDGNVGEVG